MKALPKTPAAVGAKTPLEPRQLPQNLTWGCSLHSVMCTSNIVGAKVVCGQCFHREVVIPPSLPLSQSNPSGAGIWTGQATVPPGPGMSLQKREGLSHGRPLVGLHSSQVTRVRVSNDFVEQ